MHTELTPFRALRRVAAWTAAGAFAASLQAQDSTAAGDAVDYARDVQPVLQKYCYGCHGAEKQKGEMRFDTLDPDMVRGSDGDAWDLALDVLNLGDMPPSKAPQPNDAERRTVVRWLTETLEVAAEAKRGERRTVMRRLNKAQYTNTLQDLLGVGVDFGDVLPDDGKSELGFTNNGEVLQASPLHIEYYQAIARQALEQAIVVGGRPEPTRYRVTFGKGIGKGLVAGRTGGYQSVPLSTDDFTVEILTADGSPKAGIDAAEQAALDAIKKRISIGLRGSSQERFRVVPEGMMLLSALPHRERVPKSWQGPSPNVKLEMQRCFPERGDFVMRVVASRGYIPATQELLLVPLDEPAPRASLGDDGALVRADGAFVFAANKSKRRINVDLVGDALVPKDVPKPASAQFHVDIRADGFYQLDLVHAPPTPDAMGSVRLSVGNLNLDLRPEPIAADAPERPARVVTSLGAAGLRAGRHRLRVGGPFFVGFTHLVVSRLPDDHPLVRRLIARARASTAALDDKVPAIRAFVGTRTDDGMDYKTFGGAQEVDAPFGEPGTYSFLGRLENLPIPEPESGDKEILSGFMLLGLWNDHLVKSPRETGPPLLVQSIEFEAPYVPQWPPASHRAIFAVDRESFAGDEEGYTRAVLAGFMARAFRRSVDDREVDRYLAFWRDVRPDYEHNEEAVRETLIAVLCSPAFLYLAEPRLAEGSGDADGAGLQLADEALATRLSYFLWNSPPDATLRDLVRAGRMRAELSNQVDRMLDDPRAWRFVRSFAREWLRLDRLEGMTMNVGKHPEFTRFVKRDMAEETYHFLREVIARDLDVFTLIDSDFAMLNQNLAEYYGVDDVAGPGFRSVPVAPWQRRGGLLSQGAFLAGHSDGTWPHPIKRAVWLKEKILGDAPPPPPPNVPDLDPETPGFEKLTLKQQLELHRDKASCRDCHRSIDPYGVAFENYDAGGRWTQVRRGRPVDARSELPDGTVVNGVDELKTYIQYVVPDQFAGSLIEHLFGYALGRDTGFADERELAEILERVKARGYRMRAVIDGIVSSPSFSQP